MRSLFSCAVSCGIAHSIQKPSGWVQLFVSPMQGFRLHDGTSQKRRTSIGELLTRVHKHSLPRRCRRRAGRRGAAVAVRRFAVRIDKSSFRAVSKVTAPAMKSIIGRTLLATAISHRQKASHPNKPAIKLPTTELLKLTKSLFSQRQPRRCRVGWPQRWILASVSFWHREQ